MLPTRERQFKEVPDLAPKDHQLLSAGARLYWMLPGNGLVGYIAVAIALHSPAPSWRDFAFWLGVVSLVVVRFVDVAHLNGNTADGEPATLSHWRKYSISLLLICGGIWLAAHAIAFFMEG